MPAHARTCSTVLRQPLRSAVPLAAVLLARACVSHASLLQPYCGGASQPPARDSLPPPRHCPCRRSLRSASTAHPGTSWRMRQTWWRRSGMLTWKASDPPSSLLGIRAGLCRASSAPVHRKGHPKLPYGCNPCHSFSHSFRLYPFMPACSNPPLRQVSAGRSACTLWHLL